MALYKLSKPKTFQLDYCGCTPATGLLNEQIIRNAIEFIRQSKGKRDFVKTTVTVTREGIKIIYNNEQKFSTNVPATMIAGSTIGKSSLQNTVGVVYISPVFGQHYPAFVHVYRCESSHAAQKFLSRLRSFLLIESHRLRIVQLEERLFERNLLNVEQFNARKLQKNTRDISPPAPINNNHQQKNPVDPIKSITQEFQKKIESKEPILFPLKDYDTLHVTHGNVQRAQAWKSTEVRS